MRLRALGAPLAVLALLIAPAVAVADPASLVDTRDGSLGAGFPMVAAGLPFGMIEPGPDTTLPGGAADPVNYCGYSYQDPDIRGFSLTHFDGAGIHIAGDLPFMPTTGSLGGSDPTGYASPYDHATEAAAPGYYAVTLSRYQTRVELTATTRAAIMRFTFPATTQANVLAEVSQSIDGAHPGSVTIDSDHTMSGWVTDDVGTRLYFAARFDRPFATSSATSGAAAAATATFDTSTDPVVTMRVGISYLDAAGAAANLAAEIPDSRSFDDVRSAATRTWDTVLSRATVGGGTQSRRETFEDNLYRTMLMPTVFDDADGRYLGFDGAIRQMEPGHHHYTSLSLWDSYRSQAPLLNLIDPAVAHDVLVSLLDDADQNRGVVPRWVQANHDRGIMGGDSGAVTLADGATAGLLSPTDTRRALSDLVAQATTLPPVWPRAHLDDYLKYGYVPNDKDGIGTALTLEYAIDDDAIAQLARALGDTAEDRALLTRAGFWRNLLDPSTKFLRPRNSDGTWANPTQPSDPSGLTPLSVPANLPYSPDFQDGYQEGTGWQYLWAVPQDVAGLADAIGGPPVAIKRLDRFFHTALNQPAAPAVPLAQQYASFFGVYYIGNQYTPANETDLWTPWYYDWLGQPWKSQKVVRAEMSVYNPRPDGMPGNDDTGEMSAWYVLASLGFYHVTAGVNAWALSTPTFPQATVRVGPRHLLRIEAPGASAAKPYLHGETLRGRPVSRTYLTTCELTRGGTLRAGVGVLPDRRWGAGAAAAPPSAGVRRVDVDRCTAHLAGGA